MAMQPKIKGVFKAAAAVILAAGLTGLLLWVLGLPGLVNWWRAEYVIGAFVALLIAAVVLSFRRKNPAAAPADKKGFALLALAKGVGMALGAVLLVIVIFIVIR